MTTDDAAALKAKEIANWLYGEQLHGYDSPYDPHLDELETHIAQAIRDAVAAERERLLNTPVLHEFADGVVLEALHQRERWGAEHDAGKEPLDWYWLIGWLAGKAVKALDAGDTDKALHHTISTSAVLANWHAHIEDPGAFRPGISEEKQSAAARIAAGETE